MLSRCIPHNGCHGNSRECAEQDVKTFSKWMVNGSAFLQSLSSGATSQATTSCFVSCF